jgi:hypothetical protein
MNCPLFVRKGKLSERSEAASIPFAVKRTYAAVFNAFGLIGFPCLLKPVSSGHGDIIPSGDALLNSNRIAVIKYGVPGTLESTAVKAAITLGWRISLSFCIPHISG